MNWRLIILSVYILSLACAPCVDARSSNVYAVDMIKKQDFPKHINTDICSPFCICNCCGSPILHFSESNNMSLENLGIVFKCKLSKYKFSFLSSFFANIWQPPQL